MLSLTSLALPWWGIDVTTTKSYSWGVLSGPAQLPVVTFDPGRLDMLFSVSYWLMTSAVVLTSLVTAVGSYVKRWPVLTLALIFSVATDLFFLADVGYALGSECPGIPFVEPPSCISGFVGSGISQGSGTIVVWGFKAGFYVFLASGVLILAALALRNKSRNARAQRIADMAKEALSQKPALVPKQDRAE